MVVADLWASTIMFGRTWNLCPFGLSHYSNVDHTGLMSLYIGDYSGRCFVKMKLLVFAILKNGVLGCVSQEWQF